ncbi:MAG: hypothetical protein AAGC60_04485 [Acidobacteriota bacterium]
MMRLKTLVFTLSIAALLAAPAWAQPIITAGSDIWETSGGTGYSFADNPLPPGFFCADSAAFSDTIQLEGLPLTTFPAGAAGNADTLIVRYNDVDLSAGAGIAEISVAAMSLRSQPFTVPGCDDEFVAYACTCGDQPITEIELKVDTWSPLCGRFSGQLEINVCMTFVSQITGDVLGPVDTSVFFDFTDNSFCDQGRSTTVANAFHVAAVCPGLGDGQWATVPGTSNFFPGWNAPAVMSTKTCLELYGHLTECHSSYGTADHEHCVNPVCCGSEGVPCPQ